MAAHRRSIASGRGGECQNAWSDVTFAREYLERTRNRPQSRERVVDLCSPVKRGGRSLDIGAGPGTIALPKAALVDQVTIDEPAGGMVSRYFRKSLRPQAWRT